MIIYLTKFLNNLVYDCINHIYEYILKSIYENGIYYIMNNYDYPFKVIVPLHEKKIEVYKSISSNIENQEYALSPFLIFEYLELFIGKSPYNKMTSYSGGYGKEYDGNSILLMSPDSEILDYKYVYIGSSIYQFTTMCPIIEYVSPVGNNCVPYPYAINNEGEYYLMIENVIISVPHEILSNKDFDPYDYYYNNSYIAPKLPDNRDIELSSLKSHFDNILFFYIGNERYNWRYKSDAGKHYDFWEKQEEFGEGFKIKYDDGIEKNLTREEYININDRFGDKMWFDSMEMEIICDKN